MKTYSGVEVELHAFLTSVLDGDERSASLNGRSTLWIGGWMDSRAGLDVVAKKNIPASVGNRATAAQNIALSLN
jgi:hypothetical protein